MRLLPRSLPTPAGLATGTAVLAVLLAGTAAAVAAPPAATHQQAEAGSTSSPGTSPPPPGCADRLVTFHRDGTVGDDGAVAITAQVLEREMDGWQLLAWQADTATTLTLVVAAGADGERRELSPTATGLVENVLSLTFCGSRDSSGQATTIPEPAAATTQPQPAAAGTAAVIAADAGSSPRTRAVAAPDRHEQLPHADMKAGR
ncbi:MAG: hypothetical protein R6U94_09730 [Nitriliruptoraceae bacterium]